MMKIKLATTAMALRQMLMAHHHGFWSKFSTISVHLELGPISPWFPTSAIFEEFKNLRKKKNQDEHLNPLNSMSEIISL